MSCRLTAIGDLRQSGLVCFQGDRLQTKLQEVELTCSQTDINHRGVVADREEHISKLSAEIRVLEERLEQQQHQVSGVIYLYYHSLRLVPVIPLGYDYRQVQFL